MHLLSWPTFVYFKIYCISAHSEMYVKSIFVVWDVEMLQSNSLALDNFFCSSGKCFGRRRCGFFSMACFQLFLWGLSVHFSFPPLISFILSFSLFHPPVFLISRLPFPLNKLRNAGTYFLNLGLGEVSAEHWCD